MHNVNVYNPKGEVAQVLEIDEPLTYLSGRVSKSDSGIYYKGVGVPYRNQLALNPNGHTVLKQANVFYCGYEVQNKNFVGKSGIFQETYQPYFSDFIGSCGPKELNIIRNAREFKRSAVEVLDCVNYDADNRQFYFKMNYTNGKKGYVWGGEPKDLFGLIEYMLVEGWNFPWDKAGIRDITIGGLVSDVADMFRSKELRHQLGTVYCIVYSLSRINRKALNKFTDSFGISPIQERNIPTFVIYLLEKCGINTDEVFSAEGLDEKYFYNHIIANYLLQGRNCAYVENEEYGDKVKEEYINKFIEKIGV